MILERFRSGHLGWLKIYSENGSSGGHTARLGLQAEEKEKKRGRVQSGARSKPSVRLCAGSQSRRSKEMP